MANPESKFVITAEDRATATLKRVSAEFGGLGRAALSAAGMLTGFGSALSVGVIVSQVKAVADLQDRFGKLAQQTGIGVQSLTELDYAAKLSDVSTEDLSTGITRLTSKMGDVAQGSKEAAAVFDSLGVKVKNNDGTLRSSEEVLKDIAQRFSEFADGSTKTAYAVEIFGRSGAKLIPMLNSGRDGLAEMADEARALGVVFDEKAAKAAERFNDNLTRLGQAAQGLKIELLQGLIPPLYEITQRFIEARAAGIDFIDSLDIAANIRGFGTLDEKIADVQRRLEGAKSGQWTGLFSNDVKGLQAELEKLLALRRRVEGRETAQHPAGFNAALLARGATSGAEPPRLQGPRPAAGAARIPQADLTDEQKLIVDAGKMFESSVDQTVGAAKRYQLALQMLDEAYQDGRLTTGEYDAALQKLTHTTATAGDAAYEDLKRLSDAWLDQLDPMREFTRQLEQVEQALSRGLISPEQAEAIKKRLAEALQPLSESDAWAVQAAKNIQDALGQGLYDILSGNFDNIGKSFGNMLNRMLAEATAAQLSRALFGNDFAKGGGLGGLLGDGLKWLGNLFIPSHADGLDYVPYDGYIAKLHRGERVQTAAEARNAGPSIVIQSTVAPTPGMNAAEIRALLDQRDAQLKADIGQGLRRGRYNWAMA
jgi:hypothetical protein